MRIVNRTEFLTLPSGTLYCNIGDKEDYDVMGELFIKYDTLEGNDDWVYSSLADIDTDYEGHRFDLINEAYLDSDYEIPLDTHNTYRDGLYDKDDRLFLVFSKEEVQQIVQTLNKEVLGNE